MIIPRISVKISDQAKYFLLIFAALIRSKISSISFIFLQVVPGFGLGLGLRGRRRVRLRNRHCKDHCRLRRLQPGQRRGLGKLESRYCLVVL